MDNHIMFSLIHLRAMLNSCCWSGPIIAPATMQAWESSNMESRHPDATTTNPCLCAYGKIVRTQSGEHVNVAIADLQPRRCKFMDSPLLQMPLTSMKRAPHLSSLCPRRALTQETLYTSVAQYMSLDCTWSVIRITRWTPRTWQSLAGNVVSGSDALLHIFGTIKIRVPVRTSK